MTRRRRMLMAGLSATAVVLAGAASAGGATGTLTYEGCITGEIESGTVPGGSDACDAIAGATSFGTSSGLDKPSTAAISSDGESLYVALQQTHGVARFKRNTSSGALTYKDCITGGVESGPAPSGSDACEAIPSATAGGVSSGLAQVEDVAVSADGKSVYVAAQGDDSIARFKRDTSGGALTYKDCITADTAAGPAPGGSDACEAIPTATAAGAESGLDEPQDLALTEDGKSLYVVSNDDDAIARFKRDTGNGALDYKGCITGEAESFNSGACSAGLAATGGADTGLDNLEGVGVSPDGKSVFAIAKGDDAIARFKRDTTGGALTYRGCITGESESGPSPGSDACDAIPGATTSGIGSGLDGPEALVLSADGKSVYLTAAHDDAIARFKRNTSNGALTYKGCVGGDSAAASCELTPSATAGGDNSGLGTIEALAISPDGKSIYAPSEDDAIAHFKRDTGNGALDYKGCITGEAESGPAPGGSDACAAIPSAATPFGDNSGLNEPEAAVVSPDGKSLYAIAEADDAIARFKREK